MTSMGLSFGIGSVFFEVDSEDRGEWQSSVKTTLEAIPSISNLEISLSPTIAAFRRGSNKYPAAGMVKFNIAIPSRMQKELAILPGNVGRGELFTVITIYELHHPVTFVITEEAENLSDGSQGVVLVRRFLERELNTRPGPAQMKLIGPSPFHVDASIEPADQIEEFALQKIIRRGYNRFVFSYSRASFSSVHEAAERLSRTLANELAYFYDLVEQNNKRRRVSIEIANDTQRLIARYQDNRLRTRLTRFLSSGSMMRQITLKAITAEYDIQRGISQAQVSIDNLYSADQFPCFKEYLEKEIADTSLTYLSSSKEIVALLGQDRSQQVQVASLFLSALAGGLAGALISVLVH